MTAPSPITTDELQTALARLFRGIAHEHLNFLNNILMNAELAKMSAEEIPRALQKISDNAKSGGQFIQTLLTFAGSVDFAPRERASLLQAADMAKKLTGSKAKRHNVTMMTDISDDLARLPLNTTALAITLAVLIDSLCESGPGQIVIRGRATHSSQILSLDGQSLAASVNDIRTELGSRFASQFANDHNASVDQSGNTWTLQLPE